MRSVLRYGCALLVLGALIVASRSWSDTQRPAPAPKTRIGLVNLVHVRKHYEKVKTFSKERDAAIKPFATRDNALKTEGEKLSKEAELHPNTERAERISNRLEELKRAIENNKEELRRKLARMQKEQLKILKNDIQTAVRRYAEAHAIELVQQYEEDPDPDEWSPLSIRMARPMPTAPLYAAPGIDITKEIVHALNANLRVKKSN